MQKNKMLIDAVQMRKDEILHYQINIDNYAMAMQKIKDRYTGDSELDRAMAKFYEQLKELHDTSVIEREKARLMLEVIQEQVEEQ